MKTVASFRSSFHPSAISRTPRLAPLVLTTTVLSSLLCATAANAQLLHSYNFSNGVNDSVAGVGGTLVNGASVGNGSLNMDGIDDYVQFGQQIVPNSGSYSVTLFARQNVSQAGTYSEFISQGFSGGPGFYIGFGADGNIRVTDAWQPAIPIPSVGVWHHYALTVGGGGSNFYLDGILQATLPSPIATTTGGDNTRFGTQFSTYSEYFNGSLDDIAIYGNQLSGSQVAALAAAGPSTGVVVPEAGTGMLMGLMLVLSSAAVVARRAK